MFEGFDSLKPPGKRGEEDGLRRVAWEELATAITVARALRTPNGESERDINLDDSERCKALGGMTVRNGDERTERDREKR